MAIGYSKKEIMHYFSCFYQMEYQTESVLQYLDMLGRFLNEIDHIIADKKVNFDFF